MIDLQSSILHAEDKDYTTASLEAFENLSSQGEDGALGALKYMLLCKVMLNLVSMQYFFSFLAVLTIYSLKTSTRSLRLVNSL
jgi:hypothetical protein